MSVQFNPEVWFNYGSAVVSSPPITMFARFNPTLTLTDLTLIAIERSVSQGFADFEYYSLEIKGSGGVNTIRASEVGPINSDVSETSNGAVTYNVWNDAGGVFASHSSRIAYCNGVAATENTTSVTGPTVGETYIGARLPSPGNDAFRPFCGCMQDAAIWNAALTQAEMTSLHVGVSPLQIRPASLVLYMPFYGLDTETVNLRGAPLTKNTGLASPGGSTACANGPAIMMPPKPIIYGAISVPNRVKSYNRIEGFT